MYCRAADRRFVILILLFLSIAFVAYSFGWYRALYYGDSCVLQKAVQLDQSKIKPKSNKSSSLQIRNEHYLIAQDEKEAAQLNFYFSKHPNLLKAAICYLVQAHRLDTLKRSLKLLQENFNYRFKYPILLFHEPDFLPLRDQLRRSQTGPLFFQMIKFKLPDFYEMRFGSAKKLPLCPYNQHLGYRHMCYFYSKTFFEQPSLSTLEYFWRLDDDSLIESAFIVDPFKVLRDTGAEYGYRGISLDHKLCTYNLWNLTRSFIAEHKINTTFFNQIPEDFVFYNNFEVSRLRFWRTPEFRSFINVIVAHAGSFRYRWGDAPIRTLALGLFIKPEKIVKFVDFAYGHHSLQAFRIPVLEQKKVSVRKIG